MDNIFKSSGLPKRCQVLPPRTVSMERAKVTGVIHCTTCVSIPNDKQVMQSASSVHLATAHVGVSLAKSSIATSNGKTISVEDKLINVRRPPRIERREKLLQVADSSWMEMAKPISISFLHFNMEFRDSTSPWSKLCCYYCLLA